MEREAKVYFFPKGIESPKELIDSKGFIKFLEADNYKPLESIDVTSKLRFLQGDSSAILADPKCQEVIKKYLSTIKKPKKKRARYNFLLAYEGFSENKNKQ